MSDITKQSADRRRAGRAQRRVLVSAAIGQFVEFYDFVVYAYVASTLATLFFPSHDRFASMLATFAVYAVGFGMRPLGGLLFGHLGDRIGRRGVLAAIILLMGGSTAVIGVLPTYSQIGFVAPLLLIIARLVQGLSVGGEAIGSNALVAEHAPDHRRGANVALAYAFGVIPAVFAALFVLALNNLLGDQAFESWGWRIPFLLGGVISLVGLYIRRRVSESPAFEAIRSTERVAKAPLLSVFREHRRSLGFAFAMASLSGLGFYSLTGYFPSYLTESVKLSATEALVSNSIALTAAFISMPLAGLLSDRIGRRPVLVIGAGTSALAAVPAYVLASSGSMSTAIAGQSLLAFTLGIFFGGVGVVWLELFPTRTRYSGAATALNAAYVIFGGTAPMFGTWLVGVTDSLLAPSVYLAVLAAVVFLVARRLPETHRASLVQAEDSKHTNPELTPEREPKKATP
ncbi:MFS transporter [Spirillospora sp. CA-255316]